MQQTEQYQEYSCHKCGYGKSLDTVLLDNTIYNYNKSSCWSAYLHLAASENGDDQSCYDCGDDTFLGGYSRRNTKGYGKRKGYNAYYYSGHKVGHETLTVVVPQGVEELGREFLCFYFLNNT